MVPGPQNNKMTELMARRFRAFGETCRLRLLQALETGKETVGEALDGNQPNTSKHLQILHSADVVSRRRDGTSVRYSIDDPLVLKLCKLVPKGAVDRSRADSKEVSASYAATLAKARRRA